MEGFFMGGSWEARRGRAASSVEFLLLTKHSSADDEQVMAASASSGISRNSISTNNAGLTARTSDLFPRYDSTVWLRTPSRTSPTDTGTPAPLYDEFQLSLVNDVQTGHCLWAIQSVLSKEHCDVPHALRLISALTKISLKLLMAMVGEEERGSEMWLRAIESVCDEGVAKESPAEMFRLAFQSVVDATKFKQLSTNECCGWTAYYGELLLCSFAGRSLSDELQEAYSSRPGSLTSDVGQHGCQPNWFPLIARVKHEQDYVSAADTFAGFRQELRGVPYSPTQAFLLGRRCVEYCSLHIEPKDSSFAQHWNEQLSRAISSSSHDSTKAPSCTPTTNSTCMTPPAFGLKSQRSHTKQSFDWASIVPSRNSKERRSMDLGIVVSSDLSPLKESVFMPASGTPSSLLSSPLISPSIQSHSYTAQRVRSPLFRRERADSLLDQFDAQMTSTVEPGGEAATSPHIFKPSRSIKPHEEVRVIYVQGLSTKLKTRSLLQTGSIQHPFADIAKALPNAKPGHTICLLKGIYLPFRLVHPPEKLTITCGSRGTAKIISISPQSMAPAITVEDATHLTISNLSLEAPVGLVIRRSTNVVVQNAIFCVQETFSESESSDIGISAQQNVIQKVTHMQSVGLTDYFRFSRPCIALGVHFVAAGMLTWHILWFGYLRHSLSVSDMTVVLMSALVSILLDIVVVQPIKGFLMHRYQKG